MSFNLLQEAWLPVRTQGGKIIQIRPAEIVRALGGAEEVVEPAWPRPDLNIATYELLIGLLHAACPPSSHRDWLKRWRSPPSVDALDEAFQPYADAFNLDGDGPRFMQDHERLDATNTAPTPIERLLLDAAGQNALKSNKDVLVHRDRYGAFGPAAAAIALYALQQFAPSGGAGNRTSMRGGGPLTSLAIPDATRVDLQPSLWPRIWANTPLHPDGPIPAADAHKAFPWLAPTRTSNNDETTTPEPAHAHPAQAFFGMPRRIRLQFEPGAATCDLMRRDAPFVSRGFFQKPYGVNYATWRHPLTPEYRVKEGAEWLPFHPKAGRFGFRDWVGATIGASDKLRRPAAAIAEFRKTRSVDLNTGEPRLLIAGYAMNNMEALDYVVSDRPLHAARNVEMATALDALALQMADAGEEAMAYLRRAVRSALFKNAQDVDLNAAPLMRVRTEFFDATEPTFHRLLGDAAVSGSTEQEPRIAWWKELKRAALRIFYTQTSALLRDPNRGEVVLAQVQLRAAFNGTKKKQPIHSALRLAWSPPEKAGAEKTDAAKESTT
ncbi:MAG: type I-E CRISPR-associated protein Cse1/CasA [Pseudomonadota bacterium]